MAAIVIGAITAFLVSPATAALAYNGAGASSYAETWWNSNNSNYMIINDDCTNFVSQALHSGGGLSYVGQWGDIWDDHLWWAGYNQNSGFNWSNSFTFASHLYQFLLLDIPGGIPEGTAHTWDEQTNWYTPNAVIQGDPIFYDFGDGNGISHAMLQVTATGQEDDTSDKLIPPMTGNLVNGHSNARHHEIWSLYSHNSRWLSTTIYFIHIAASNP